MNNSEVSHKIKRFEDLIAWQKARNLTKKIYEVTRRGRFRNDYGFLGRFKGLRFRSCLMWRKGSNAVGWVNFTSFFPLQRRPVRNFGYSFTLRVTSDILRKSDLQLYWSKLKKLAGLSAVYAHRSQDNEQVSCSAIDSGLISRDS